MLSLAQGLHTTIRTRQLTIIMNEATQQKDVSPNISCHHKHLIQLTTAMNALMSLQTQHKDVSHTISCHNKDTLHRRDTGTRHRMTSLAFFLVMTSAILYLNLNTTSFLQFIKELNKISKERLIWFVFQVYKFTNHKE